MEAFVHDSIVLSTWSFEKGLPSPADNLASTAVVCVSIDSTSRDNMATVRDVTLRHDARVRVHRDTLSEALDHVILNDGDVA